MNHKNVIYYYINKVKPNYGPLIFLRVAPSTTYGGISIDLNSGSFELLHLVGRRTRLTVSIVLTTDRYSGWRGRLVFGC